MVTIYDLPNEVIKNVFVLLLDPPDNREDTRRIRSPPYGVLRDDEYHARNRVRKYYSYEENPDGTYKSRVNNDKNFVLNASMVSRRWYRVGIETLYSDIYINEPDGVLLLRDQLQRPLFRRFDATNELTARFFVRRIDVVDVGFPANFLDTMNDLFAACVNLEVLSYETTTRYSLPSQQSFLRRAASSLPNLRRLKIDLPLEYITDPRIPPFVFTITPFQSLTVLELHENTRYHQHSSDYNAPESHHNISFPNLRSLILFGLGRYSVKAMVEWNYPCICHMKLYGECYGENVEDMRHSILIFLRIHGAKLLSLELLNRILDREDMATMFQSCPNLLDLHTDISNLQFASDTFTHAKISRISLSFVGYVRDGGWDAIVVDAFGHTCAFIQALKDKDVFPSLTRIFMGQQTNKWGRWYTLSQGEQQERQEWATILASRSVYFCDESEFISGSGVLNHKSIHLAPTNFCLIKDGLYF